MLIVAFVIFLLGTVVLILLGLQILLIIIDTIQKLNKIQTNILYSKYKYTNTRETGMINMWCFSEQVRVPKFGTERMG